MATGFSFAAKASITAAACLLVASLVATARDREKAQLAGRWNFNPEVSDHSGQTVLDGQQSNSGNAGRSYPSPAGPYPGEYPGGVDVAVDGGVPVRVGDPNGTVNGEARVPIGGRVGGPNSDPNGEARAPAGGPAGGINYPGGNSGDPGTGGGQGGPQGATKGGGSPNTQAWDGLARNSKFLQINQQTQQIVITDDSGHSRTYFPDGKKHQEKNAGGNKISTKAEWNGSSLIAETRLAHGEILTESFRRSKDGSQLYVKTRLESPALNGPVNIRRVYDLAKTPTN